MSTLTDVAPAGLVPAAWTVALAAHFTTVVTEQVVLAMLVVMAVILAAFYLVGRSEMDGPVLGVWRLVVLNGLFATLAGIAGIALEPRQPLLIAVALYGWMLLPGPAFARTARRVADGRARTIYGTAAGASFAGAVLYGAGDLGGTAAGLMMFLGLVVVGLGQTAGIVTAAYRNSGPDAPVTP